MKKYNKCHFCLKRFLVQEWKKGIERSVCFTCRFAFNQLPNKYRDIITLREGLLDGERKTLQKVGQVFDITRERARQIEAEGEIIMDKIIKIIKQWRASQRENKKQ